MSQHQAYVTDPSGFNGRYTQVTTDAFGRTIELSTGREVVVVR